VALLLLAPRTSTTYLIPTYVWEDGIVIWVPIVLTTAPRPRQRLQGPFRSVWSDDESGRKDAATGV